MTNEIDMQKELENLPAGYITRRTINGKTYLFHQGSKNGKQFSHSIQKEEAEILEKQIQRRKQLENELKKLNFTAKRTKTSAQETASAQTQRFAFSTNVMYGNLIEPFTESAKNYEKRDCYSIIENYINEKIEDKVCVVYVLRRTGKTTLIKQIILSFSDEQKSKTAYIKCTVNDTIAALNNDIKQLRDSGFKYLFIDEVTLLEDFIESSSLFSDIYAAQGIKIILSGTDSLGFHFAINDELYDRAIMIHTTYIPFKEHSRLLGINDIDEYIRYGGTLKAGELDFENREVNAKNAPFRDDESTRHYIDTAICSNIQHSLECFKDGRYFRHLKTLYEENELTNAINRIIESMNHDFTVKIITETFKSHDLRSASQMLRTEKDKTKRTSALDEIDTAQILTTLKKILSIKEKEEQKIGITEIHIEEIKEYLKSLDLIEKTNIETRFADKPSLNASEEYYIFTQPGIRFCQAQALIYSLLKDPQIDGLDSETKDLIESKITEDVQERMLEDIVMLETRKSFAKKWNEKRRAFKLRFADGEFDMIIVNPENKSCEIYKVKHTEKRFAKQYKNLVDDEKVSLAERAYGKITKKTVLYKGENHTEPNGIEYKNVEEYLKELA